LRYWGTELEEAPKDKERQQKSIEILGEFYEKVEKNDFMFRIPCWQDSSKFDYVCEAAFLVALGKSSNMEVNQVCQ
jgi:hypothetical protein